MAGLTGNSPAIETRDLTKTFGSFTAVNALNLRIERGELYGLVGPDGAGKTTTLRMLASVMLPTSGQARVLGHDVVKEGERIKEEIGYMAQRFGLYEDLTVMENILFYADLYDVPRRERKARTERLLGFSNLTPFTGRLAGKLSGGMKQKLGLACALIHTPRLLFLDEPTNGVDPVSRRDFWRILYSLWKEGMTIVFSTAYIDEAERCTRIGLMNKGAILLEDRPGVLKRSIPVGMIELWCSDTVKAAAVAAGVEGVARVNNYGNKLHISYTRKPDQPDFGQTVAGRVEAALQAQGIQVENHREIVPSLEDVFIEAVGR